MPLDESVALRSLLVEGVLFDPLYPHRSFGTLTDHLPMALTALHALGASAAQLRRFRDAYAPRLIPRRGAVHAALAENDWRAALGQHAALPAFADLFERALAVEGRAAVLKRWLPRLIDAVAVDALHPLIRVAAALSHDADVELAAGLAYWCADFQKIPHPQPNRLELTAEQLFVRLRQHPVLRATPFRASGIHGFGARLNALAAMPIFNEMSGWRPLSMDLSQLARESARIYLGTESLGIGNFFALHMVTGSHALRGLLPYLDDTTHVLDRWWQALAATYVIIDVPEYDSWRAAPRAPVPDRARMLAAGMAAMHGDDAEHTIKLLWSADQDYTAYGHQEHAQIVARLCAR